MTDAELVKAERAFRAEIPRAQALLVEIRRELKKRRRAANQHHEGKGNG
jgi:hypothetical protein